MGDAVLGIVLSKMAVVSANTKKYFGETLDRVLAKRVPLGPCKKTFYEDLLQ